MRINGRTFYEICNDSKHNKVYLFHESVEEAVKAKEKLDICGISVDGILYYGDSCRDKNLIDGGFDLLTPETLADRDGGVEDVLVIYLGDNIEYAYELLRSFGFEPVRNIKWIKRYCVENLTKEYTFDPINGFDKIGNYPEFPGYVIYGNPCSGSKTSICVVGGSSTDADWFFFKSWPEFLYEICIENDHNVIVMNGGVMGYAAQQELMKVLRDIPILKPDIVISFSGVNNNHLVNEYPFLLDFNLKVCNIIEKDLPVVNLKRLKPFHGLKTKKDSFNRYEYWLNFEKTMHFYSSQYGAKFYGILQPNLMSKKELLPEEEEYLANRSFMGRYGLTPKEYSNITKGFSEYVRKENQEWLVDMSHIFDKENKSVYLDGIHVNERGNYVTAQNVYELIKDSL